MPHHPADVLLQRELGLHTRLQVQDQRRARVRDHTEWVGVGSTGRREPQCPMPLHAGGTEPLGRMREPQPGRDTIAALQLGRHLATWGCSFSWSGHRRPHAMVRGSNGSSLTRSGGNFLCRCPQAAARSRSSLGRLAPPRPASAAGAVPRAAPPRSYRQKERDKRKRIRKEATGTDKKSGKRKENKWKMQRKNKKY
jgi:hypothetical protein